MTRASQRSRRFGWRLNELQLFVFCVRNPTVREGTLTARPSLTVGLLKQWQINLKSEI
jgi:hypothetical protein